MKKILTRSRKAPEASSNHEKIQKLINDLAADPSFASTVSEFLSRTQKAPRQFGSNGLKVNGKLFALFTQGTLVVKLPPARVSILVAEGVGKPFDPGHGRLMRGWLSITNRHTSWLDLAREAFTFVREAT